MLTEVVVVFISLVLVSLVWVYIYIDKLTSESASKEFKRVLYEYDDRFLLGLNPPEFIILPTTSIFLSNNPNTIPYLMAVIKEYEKHYGSINVDKDGNKFEVQVRGKDGRFLAS